MKVTTTKGLHTNKVKVVVYGQSGAGKTKLASTLQGSTLIGSAESGLLSLADYDIDAVELKSYADVIEFYKFAAASDYENIFIDSLTEISLMLVSVVENDPKYSEPKMAMKMWGEYSKRISKLIKTFRNMDKNVIFTALPESVNDNGIIIKRPYIAGSKIQGLLPSFFDEFFYLNVSPTGERSLQTQPDSIAEAKDRSGKLEESESADLQAVFNKIKDVKQ